MGKSYLLALSMKRSFQRLSFSPFQQLMAPSYIEIDLLGITLSSSIPKTEPKPSHILQAP